VVNPGGTSTKALRFYCGVCRPGENHICSGGQAQPRAGQRWFDQGMSAFMVASNNTYPARYIEIFQTSEKSLKESAGKH
jgi:hypothetical protein